MTTRETDGLTPFTTEGEDEFLNKDGELEHPNLQKVRLLKFGPNEREFLDGLRDIADNYVLSNLGTLLTTVYDLYDKVREPVLDEETGEPKRDEKGLVVYATYEDGGYIEDFSQLSLGDLDSALLSLSLQSFFGALRVDDLYLEAAFAKYIYQDVQDAEFAKAEGTNPVREAVAKAKSRDWQYQAFAKSYLYYRVRDLLIEADKLARRIEAIRRNRSSEEDSFFRSRQASKRKGS